MKRVLLIPTLVLVLLGTLCYLLSAGPMAGKISDDPVRRPIVFCSSDDIKTLDPGKMSWMNDIRTAMGLWEGLATFDPVTLAPQPGIAESWDLSADQMTYTFHLRKDSRWSNGDPVTAQDFLFAWKRTLAPATGADYGELFNCIRGVREYSAALAAYAKTRKSNPSALPPDFSSVGVSAPDPYTLIVNLVIPTRYFLDLASFPPFYPLHEQAMRPFLLDPADPDKGYTGSWTRPPTLVTNGPFQLVDWKLRQYLVLEPNPHYWDRSHVLCERIIMKAIPRDERAALLAYQTGTVDILSFVPQEFGDDLMAAQEQGKKVGKDVHYRPVFGTYYYLFNCSREPLNDKRVRKALALAIDRQEIVDKVTRMHQKPLTLLVPPNSIPGYESPPSLPVAGDLAEARRLLASAGFPGGAGMRSIEILYTTDVPIHGRISQAISQMWKQNLGIDVTLRGLERPGFSNARQQDHAFDVARGGWYGDYPDPTTWLDLCNSTNGNNDGKFNSPAYDKLLELAAATEHDSARRMALLRDAENLLVNDELAFIPLYQYGDGYIYDDQKLTGCDVNVRLLTEFKYFHRVP